MRQLGWRCLHWENWVDERRGKMAVDADAEAGAGAVS